MFITEQTFTQDVTYNADNDSWKVTETEMECMQRRNAYAKVMKAQGYQVRCRSFGLQLLSFGGIGSGAAHYTLWVKAYGVEVFE